RRPVLYPAALGLGPIDPYAWGFAGWGLPIVLLVFAAWCWTTGRGVVALILFGAVAAYDLRLMESENLWDYVLDPFVALAGAVRGWWRTKAPRPDEAPADSSSHMTSLSGT
ncbi:MAG: hypothetical protein OER88_13090, partial [Planctomycetota bacterium]|nr:hypothetical protein [Planctomycetota bacterium]